MPKGIYERESLGDRFWFKVDIKSKDECWEWLSCKIGEYGVIWVIDGNEYAHRIAWELYNKKKIPKDKQINHTCDNRPCCNPKHLKLGTHQDNFDDMILKGRDRHIFGESHYKTKLTNKQVIRIRRLAGLIKRDGTRVFLNIDLARHFNISGTSVSLIINRKRWKHII